MNDKEKPAFQLSRMQSIVFLTVFGAVTMAARLYIEPLLRGNYLVSVAIGGALLGFAFFLHKIGVLNFEDDKNKTH